MTVMAILDKVCGCHIYCERRLFSDYSSQVWVKLTILKPNNMWRKRTTHGYYEAIYWKWSNIFLVDFENTFLICYVQVRTTRNSYILNSIDNRNWMLFPLDFVCWVCLASNMYNGDFNSVFYMKTLQTIIWKTNYLVFYQFVWWKMKHSWKLCNWEN